MNNFYFLIVITLIASAVIQRIQDGVAHPILVFGAIAGVIYIGMEIQNHYFSKKRKA